jgi:2-polyprenyl-3-methyl-5-hydroxy-6-metoxy-1,4-benzoquinol methylase
MSSTPLQQPLPAGKESSVNPKLATAELYGEDYQRTQAQKYRDRERNHWKTRIALANDLVDKFVLPRMPGRSTEQINVVDIGCSIGTFAIEFAKRGFASIGVDYDDAALAIARELAQEEGVSLTFIEGDHKLASQQLGGAGDIDIAVCFDLFEHLFDDQLGALFYSLRESLSPTGALVFHTFPTELDHLFVEDQCNATHALADFSDLEPKAFEKLSRAYASMFDAYLLMTTGKSHREKRSTWQHCNTLSQSRLQAMLERGGFDVVFIETKQLYSFNQEKLEQFIRQPASHHNLYGVAVPA